MGLYSWFVFPSSRFIAVPQKWRLQAAAGARTFSLRLLPLHSHQGFSPFLRVRKGAKAAVTSDLWSGGNSSSRRGQAEEPVGMATAPLLRAKLTSVQVLPLTALNRLFSEPPSALTWTRDPGPSLLRARVVSGAEEERRRLLVYKRASNFSCGSLPRILSASCLARKRRPRGGRRRRATPATRDDITHFFRLTLAFCNAKF